MEKYGKVIKRIFVIWLIFLLLCLAILPLFHKSVEYKEEPFSPLVNMETQERILSINDNMDALLWRLRLIEAARERVIRVFDSYCYIKLHTKSLETA